MVDFQLIYEALHLAGNQIKEGNLLSSDFERYSLTADHPEFPLAAIVPGPSTSGSHTQPKAIDARVKVSYGVSLP